MLQSETKNKSFSLLMKPSNKPNTQIPSKSTLDISVQPINKPVDPKINEEKQPDIKNIVNKYYFPLSENFEILDNIGTGSESWVSKVIHKKTKRELALKYIKTKEEKRNVNELKISFKLKNENIIRFFNYCCSKDDRSEIILMENAKFGNLRTFQYKSLKKVILSETMINFFANEILKGLLFCHKNKVAHLDLKPQNIVIDEYLHAKLIDFSISINYIDKSMNDKIRLPFKGTKLYMPLEIMNSQIIEYKDINKVDAYALGIILFNLAFGYYPYDLKHEDSYETIIEKIKNNKLEIKNENNLSSYFIDFLRKLLEKDIDKRISIYEAANHYWIKGGNILYDEKEKMYNIYSFTTKLITDNIKDFNDYLLK